MECSRLSMLRPASGPYWWHHWTSVVSRSQPRRQQLEGLSGWVNSSTEEFMTIIVLTARKLVFSLHLKIPRDTSWRPLVCDSIQNSPEIPSAFRHHVPVTPKWERAERRLGVQAREFRQDLIVRIIVRACELFLFLWEKWLKDIVVLSRKDI